jgi:hypothetical protein
MRLDLVRLCTTATNVAQCGEVDREGTPIICVWLCVTRLEVGGSLILAGSERI